MRQHFHISHHAARHIWHGGLATGGLSCVLVPVWLTDWPALLAPPALTAPPSMVAIAEPSTALLLASALGVLIGLQAVIRAK